jgi:hypothetical protein
MKDRSYETTKHYIGKNNFAFAIKLVGPNPEILLDPSYYE